MVQNESSVWVFATYEYPNPKSNINNLQEMLVYDKHLHDKYKSDNLKVLNILGGPGKKGKIQKWTTKIYWSTDEIKKYVLKLSASITCVFLIDTDTFLLVQNKRKNKKTHLQRTKNRFTKSFSSLDIFNGCGKILCISLCCNGLLSKKVSFSKRCQSNIANVINVVHNA